ncbi:UNVERIFIED_CONTAM: hypothetical protein RMT77_010801 [Armadillidium vulgare]
MMIPSAKLRLRKNILPKNLPDLSACIFLCAAMPTVYWFEIFIVSPTLFDWPLYIFHIILGTFVLVNVAGNFLAIMFVETSTKRLVLPSQVPKGWHVCAECESVAPPRSRHCNTCKACILKKEHHCIFTGCCVGLSNHRYFFVFLIYIWLSTLYCSGLNIFFIWPYVGGLTWWALIRLLLPGIWLVWNPCFETLYAFLFSINFIGFLFLTVLVFYYTNLIFNNVTTQENNSGNPTNLYDQGSRKENVKVALGKRWYLTWLFPTIWSPLPYDGFEWSIPYSDRGTQSVRPKCK